MCLLVRSTLPPTEAPSHMYHCSSHSVSCNLQDALASWQLSWAYDSSKGPSTVHVDNVTGATLDSQNQSGIQISSNTSIVQHTPANVTVDGLFNPALPDPSTAGLQLLKLQGVMLNGQTCSLTGIQPVNIPSSPPALAPSPQVLASLSLPCQEIFIMPQRTTAKLCLSRTLLLPGKGAVIKHATCQSADCHLPAGILWHLLRQHTWK